MEKLLKFIDEWFIDLGGNIYKEHVITMNDLKTLEKLVKAAIKSREN